MRSSRLEEQQERLHAHLFTPLTSVPFFFFPPVLLGKPDNNITGRRIFLFLQHALLSLIHLLTRSNQLAKLS